MDGENIETTIIPASGNDLLVMPLTDGEKPIGLYKTPIVAWAVSREGGLVWADPVTNDGKPLGEDFAYQMNGASSLYEIPWDRDFDGDQELVEYFAKQAAKKRRRKADH